MRKNNILVVIFSLIFILFLSGCNDLNNKNELNVFENSLRDALDLTTIIVSHDVAETLSIADYIYVVAEGKVQGEGTPEQLKQHPSAFVQQFLNGSVEGPVDYQFSHQPYLTAEGQA